MPKITIVIPGSVVSKKNSKIATMVGGKNVPRRVIILPSNAYRKWEKQARVSLCGKRYALSCEISVEAHFYYRGNRPDLAGGMESISDCLQGIIWENDRQIISWDGSRLHHDLKNPRTEITVRWE